MEPVVSVRGLKKRYGDVDAVAGIDLEVQRGEIFAFLGPNGAGKTTTVEILEGFRTRTAGEVSVLGVDPAHGDTEWRNRVGAVLQESNAEPGLTVRESLELYSGYYLEPRDIDETIALVGATGAGKSTALALLHRAFDPQSGSVKIDGMDIRGLKLSALRHNIGVVFQEALLFNRSIAENLQAGKADATEAEMRDACARAQALEFIERSEHGFDTNAGERGRMLSGGERQRLSIARALLKDPPILILDEATSALDAVTEAKVNAALDEVMKGRTTFVIAHRLSTIRNATRILVFDKGRVIETGTFDELVAQGGRFAELARAQFMVQENSRASLAVPEASIDAA